jgi:hypothetical protein
MGEWLAVVSALESLELVFGDWVQEVVDRLDRIGRDLFDRELEVFSPEAQACLAGELGVVADDIHFGVVEERVFVASILMFAFLVLSSSPGYEVKSLAIGLAAGIIFDATVIRALLVPALMKLLGDANWWMPKWTSTMLRISHREPTPEITAESA